MTDLTPLPEPDEAAIKSKPRLGIAILIGVLCSLFLTSLVATGFFYLRNNTLQIVLNLPTILTPPKPTNIQPTITPDPTTNWQTYLDKNHDFQIQYPPNTQIISSNKIFELFYPTHPPLGLHLYLDIIPNPKGKPLKDIGDQYFPLSFPKAEPNNWSWSFQGRDQILTTTRYYPGIIDLENIYLINYNHQVYAIRTSFSDQHAPELVALKNQMISTFKFIYFDKVNWDLHRNINSWIYFNLYYQADPQRNFRFKYPSILELNNKDSGPVNLSLKENSYFALISLETTQPLSSLDGINSDEQLQSLYLNDKYSPLQDNNYSLIIHEFRTWIT
ncbi:hypothetical protein A2W24_02735 [Microgenomates group bacterium RBG_16_45_19]|nr:MAG: hypothetical protein A2W24_02735 [Microgenomates group bacterium RBG_16_45_19]